LAGMISTVGANASAFTLLEGVLCRSAGSTCALGLLLRQSSKRWLVCRRGLATRGTKALCGEKAVDIALATTFTF
jgi:hypothetical protein